MKRVKTKSDLRSNENTKIRFVFVKISQIKNITEDNYSLIHLASYMGYYDLTYCHCYVRFTNGSVYEVINPYGIIQNKNDCIKVKYDNIDKVCFTEDKNDNCEIIEFKISKTKETKLQKYCEAMVKKRLKYASGLRRDCGRWLFSFMVKNENELLPSELIERVYNEMKKLNVVSVKNGPVLAREDKSILQIYSELKLHYN